MTKRQLISIIVAVCLLLSISTVCLVLFINKNNTETTTAEHETNKIHEHTYEIEVGDKINVFDIVGEIKTYSIAIDDGLKFKDGILYAIDEGTYNFTVFNTDNDKYSFTIIVDKSTAQINVKYNNDKIDSLCLENDSAIELEIIASGVYDKIEFDVSDNLLFSDNILTATSVGNGYLDIVLIKNDIVVCDKLINVNVLETVDNLIFSTDALEYYGEESICGNLIINSKNLILSNLSINSDAILFNTSEAIYEGNNIIIPFTSFTFGEISYEIVYNNIYTTHSNQVTTSGTICAYKYTNDIQFVVNNSNVSEINLSLFDTNFTNEANADGFFSELVYSVKFNEYSNNLYNLEYDSNIIAIDNDKIIALSEGSTTLSIKALDGSNYNKTININVNTVLPSAIQYNGLTDVVVTELFSLNEDDFEILPVYAKKDDLLINGGDVEDYILDYGTNTFTVNYGSLTLPVTINVYSKLEEINYNIYDFGNTYAIEVFVYNHNNERVNLQNLNFIFVDDSGNTINFERREGNFIYFLKEVLVDGTLEVYNSVDKISTKITL